MKYLSGWRGFVYLATSGCFDLVGWCCRGTLLGQPGSTGMWPLLGLFISSQFQTPAPENTTCEKKKKKNDWLKNRQLFFITENFLGILNRLCAEPIRRSHDFLILTLAIVGSTSGSCYFLLQCRCLWVCVLCFSS